MEFGFSPNKALYGQLEFLIDTWIRYFLFLEAKVYNCNTNDRYAILYLFLWALMVEMQFDCNLRLYFT